MNVIQRIRIIRELSGDMNLPYSFSDEVLIEFYNAAQKLACQGNGMLKSSDMKIGETISSSTLTVLNSPGSVISSIKINGVDILPSPLTFNTDILITALDLKNLIDSTGLFSTTRLDHVITLNPLPGNGAFFNGITPLVEQSGTMVVATPFSGGIDGICRLSIVPNQREYRISDRIYKFKDYRYGTSKTKMIPISNNEFDVSNSCFSGTPNRIIYGFSDYDIVIDSNPTNRSFINFTVEYEPLDLENKNSIFEIPNRYVSFLDDYVLYKIYSKEDYETSDQVKSSKYLSSFYSNFPNTVSNSHFRDYYKFEQM